jgi:hypothetical protein
VTNKVRRVKPMSEARMDRLAELWPRGISALAYSLYMPPSPWQECHAMAVRYLEQMIGLARELGAAHPASDLIVELAGHVQAWLRTNPETQDPADRRAAAVADWNGRIEGLRAVVWDEVWSDLDIRPGRGF